MKKPLPLKQNLFFKCCALVLISSFLIQLLFINLVVATPVFDSSDAYFKLKFAGSTTSLASGANPSCIASNLTLTATVSPGIATGSVEFFDGASSLGTSILVLGSATLSTSSLTAGTHSLTAVYSGDINYTTSTSFVLAQIINAAIPAIPGTVSGVTAQCPSLIEQIYSIALMSDVSGYNWTLPTGWAITNGTGTETISVTTGTTGQNGNVSVSASNACGTGPVKILPVTVGNPIPSVPGTISGTSPVCPGVTALTYSIAAVTNATGYSWVVPSGWVITAGAGTTSITVTSGSAGGNITVAASNACGTSAAQTKLITLNPAIPSTPGTISGTTPVCPSVAGLVYSIAAVANATSYTWGVPSGWTITAGATTNSVTITSGTVAGNITVAAINSCGSSAAPKIVNVNPVSSLNNTGYTDGTTKFSDGITSGAGQASPLINETRGFLKFPLSVLPAGVTVTASALKLTNNSSVSSGAVSYVRGLGATDPVSAAALSIFSAAGAGTNYNAGAWSASGQISLALLAAANTDITNSITSPGYISMGLVRSSVNLYNFYGFSSGANVPVLSLTYASVRALAVTMNPAIPSVSVSISGASIACPSSANIYNIAAVTGATTYAWIVPAGWSITSGQGTTSITVTAGAAGQNGNVTVAAGNSCGSSAAQIFAVSVTTIPTVGATPLSQTRCSGIALGTINITNPNAVAGTTFTWVRDAPLLTGMASSGSGSSITGTLTNLTGVQQTVTFTIYASAAGCVSVLPAAITVIVNPNPGANAGIDQFTCSSTTATIGGSPTASGGTAGYTYSWTTGVSNTAIANPTALPGTYTVTVTDSKGCQAADAVTIGTSTGTKTWIGAGTASLGTTNFNSASNWSPAGVPGSCNDVIMNVDISSITDYFSGALTVAVNAATTVKSLSITVGGTLLLSTTSTFNLSIGSQAFTVLNATTINTNATNILAIPARSYISVGAGGVLTYGGTLTSTVSNSSTNFPFYAALNNVGKIYINGDANLAGIGNDPSNKPAQIIFNGAATQTITQNSGTQPIYLAATSTDIGETNSPTVVLAGTGTGGYRAVGDLNINNTSTLDLGTVQFLNRYTAGGTINMAAGSFLKLGKNSGGVSGSNFPANFSTYNFNAASTVDYNAAAAQNIYPTPLYGNLTLSTSGTKTVTANSTAQKNITIAGSAVLAGGTFTIALGGNWSSYGQAGFSEQTSTVDFNGTSAQSISSTGGEIFYALNKSAAGTTTMLSDVSVQGSTPSFTLSAGTFDAGTFSFNSTSGTLNISAGLLKLAKTGTALLPEFTTASYNLSGGTIELYGAGGQVLRGARAYRNLTFSTSGLKTLSSAITAITGTVLTQNSVTLDVSNNTMGGGGTNLTMTGTSTYKTAGTGTKPDAQGTYSLGTGTTVEFTNAAATTEDIRLTLPTYYNIVVSGSNVANPSLTTGIKFQAGGTFTVKNAGLFKLGNTVGFSGAAATSVQTTNNPSIVLEDGSTVEYYGAPAGTNPQAITNVVPYSNLIFSGMSVKTAPAGTLTVRGNLTNINSGFAHNNGTVLLNGASVQNYNSAGTTLDFYNLTAANLINVNINNDLRVINLLSLSTSGKLNLAGGNVVLRSTAAKTASVDKILVPNSLAYGGAGRFVVERYLPTGVSHGKSWQFLATPAFGQSLNASWQENNLPLIVGLAGLGTTISSESPTAVSRGYDFYTAPGPSIKTYNSVINTWVGTDDGVSSTSSIPLANPKGYMIFIRGDRSVQTSATAANVTTLRSTGKIYSPGTFAPASIIVPAARLGSVGNPYASAIDFSSLVATSSGIDNKYYVWDPLLAGSSGYGGYQLLSSSNAWLPAPGGTLNYPTGIAYTKIQSGQAFFTYATAGGTVNFSENNKVAGSPNVYRHNLTDRQFFRSYLYGEAGNLADGNVIALDKTFSRDFDSDDAIKIFNAADNFSIASNNRILMLQATRPVEITDTFFYSLTNLHPQTYLVKFAPENMPANLTALLIDRYTGIQQPISVIDSSYYNFTVTSDTASAARDRLLVVFNKKKAIQHNSTPLPADSGMAKPFVTVYPNPVADHQVNLHFAGQETGTYNLSLTNEIGQVVLKSRFELQGNESAKTFRLGKEIAAGPYQLIIKKSNSPIASIKLMVN